MAEWLDIVNNFGVMGLLAAFLWWFVNGRLFSKRQVEYMRQQVAISQQIADALAANTKQMGEMTTAYVQLSSAFSRMADILASLTNNGGTAVLRADKRAVESRALHIGGVGVRGEG